MAGKQNKCCCGGICDGVILFDTGEVVAGDPCDTSIGIDQEWTANGGDAFAFFTGGTTDFDDPTRLIGCEGVAGITAVCADDIADKAIIEPGGLSGFETTFTSQFYIPPTTNLSRIALVGTYSADNYVVAGEWKINGVDQDHIEHGSFYDGFTLGCIDFAVTSDTAPLVHGWNTITIIVKNGNSAQIPITYGGPTFLKLQWECVERKPCDTFTIPWVGFLTGGGGLIWDPYDSSECPVYCGTSPEPSYPPTYEGEIGYAECPELP